MLAEPAFSRRFADRQPHGVLLQANRIARVLIVHGVHAVRFEILVDTPLIQIHAAAALIEPARAVAEAEEVVLFLGAHLLEMLIAAAVEQFLGMRDVEGIGQLRAADREGAESRAFAGQLHDRLFAPHDATGNASDLAHALLAFDAVQRAHGRQVIPGHHELRRAGGAPLIAVPVVMDGLGGLCESLLLAKFKAPASDVFRVGVAVIAHVDGLGITNLDPLPDEGDKFCILERRESAVASGIHLLSEEILVGLSHNGVPFVSSRVNEASQRPCWAGMCTCRTAGNQAEKNRKGEASGA